MAETAKNFEALPGAPNIYRVIVTGDMWAYDTETNTWVVDMQIQECDYTLQEDSTLTIFLDDDGMKNGIHESFHEAINNLIDDIYENQWIKINTFSDHARISYLGPDRPQYAIIIMIQEFLNY